MFGVKRDLGVTWVLATAVSLAACSGEDGADGGLTVFDSGGNTSLDATANPDATPGDTGVTVDAGEVDAGEPMDAEPTDAPAPGDAEPADMGEAPDAGPGDAEPQDAPAPGDAEPADMGNGTDAGPGDAEPGDVPAPGDAGPADAAPGDAGPADGGGGGVTMCNPTFGASDACGGNIVGTWTYQSACSDQIPYQQQIQMGCPAGAMVTVSNVTRAVSGTLTLDANGTFARNLSLTISGQISVPAACLMGLTCAALPAYLPLLVPGTSGTCVQGASGCDCQVTSTTATNDTGPYVVNNNVVTTGTSVDTRNYWYCVDANGNLSYRGLPNQVTDNDTTYVLSP